MSPRHQFGVAAALVTVSAFLPAAAAAVEAPRCGAAAADLAEEIATNLSDTAYVHTALKGDPDVTLAKGQWRAFTDCSGFVSFVVGETAPQPYQAVFALKEPSRPWPRAHVYRRFFANLARVAPSRGWAPVRDLRKAQPGDILAWCLNDFCDATGDVSEPGDTGHIVVIARVLPLDNETLSVTVYDSSADVHYGNPPYVCAPNGDRCETTGRDGVGVGAIHFKINAGGQPVAFQFNASGHFHPEAGETIQFAIGRLTKLCR